MTEQKVVAKRRRRSWRKTRTGMILERLGQNKLAMIGLIIIALLAFMAIFAPVIAPYSPTYQDFSAIYCKPNGEHWFGCDALGRDIFSRCVYGARYSLSLGLAATVFGSAIGLFFGVFVGYIGGRTDNLVMRLMDIVSAIPGMLLAVIISTALGSGVFNTILAMSVGTIPCTIRQTRALCLKERQMEYIEASVSVNCPKLKIMFSHMLPNIFSPLIVGMTMGIGFTIMGAAGLSFIGLGLQPQTAEWGAMLTDGRSMILLHPHLMLFPGLMIALTVLSFNLFGDGLRDALDPRLKD